MMRLSIKYAKRLKNEGLFFGQHPLTEKSPLATGVESIFSAGLELEHWVTDMFNSKESSKSTRRINQPSHVTCAINITLMNISLAHPRTAIHFYKTAILKTSKTGTIQLSFYLNYFFEILLLKLFLGEDRLTYDKSKEVSFPEI